MKKENTETKKITTICEVLNKHTDQFYPLIEQGKIEESRLKVLELLNDETLKSNPDVPKAKRIFEGCKGKTNSYLSTLGTYLTCDKVL